MSKSEQNPEKLLNDVKCYLQISWDDPPTDRRLVGIIARSMARLREIAGAPLDFFAEGPARDLLLDRCRYANSNALEAFEENFGAELLALHLNHKVEGIPDEAENAN